MKLISLLLLPVLLSALVSCGDTNREVIDRYKPRFDKFRAELKLISDEVPKIPEKLPAELPLDPKPQFHEGGPGSNTSILMHEQLVDPEVNLNLQKKLDLMLGNSFDIHLSWTGSPSSMSDDVLGDTAGGMDADLRQSLKLRYIGVVRVLRYVEPTAIDEESFTGGKATLGVHLWDRIKKKMICSSTVESTSDDKVKFSYRDGGDRAAALKEFAASTLYTNSRKLVLKTLAEQTGGSFEAR